MAYGRLAVLLLVLGMVTPLDAAEPANQRPDAATAAQLVKSGAVLLDVRTQEEWDEGHVKAARFAPWQTLELSSAALPKDKNTPIVTYCRSGARAQLAAQKLRGLGYTRVVAMEGGLADLEAAGVKVEK
ncbi:MAG: rhodanese-like domain-containing protein [Nevskiaceae bacterium]